MNKKGIVSKIETSGTWTSNDGVTFYKFVVEFDNGDRGDFLQKSNEILHQVGKEEEYEITTNENGYHKIKWINNKPAFTRTGAVGRNPEEEKKRQLWIVRQSSLKCATKLCAQGRIKHDDILSEAETFTAWVMGEIKAQKMTAPTDSMPF